MTTNQARIAALAAALALPVGIASVSIATAQNAVQAPVHTAAARPAAPHAALDNDAETNDDGAQAKAERNDRPETSDAAGDGDGETNDDGASANRSR